MNNPLTSLQRKQVDELLKPFANLPSQAPRTGWIRTVRTALGMTLEQMGTRLERSRQAVSQLEKGEVSGTITVGSLRSAANALDCDLVIGLRPRSGSLENAVKKQAAMKAHNDESAVLHTMALENQTEGLEKRPDVSSDIEWWLTENSARLWD